MSSLSGVLFAAFMLAALLLDNTPNADQPDRWSAYFAKDSNQLRGVISAYLWVLAGIALLGFVLVLRERMNGRMHPFSFIAGIVAGGALCVAGGLTGAVAGTLLFADGPNPSGELAIFISSLSYPVIMISAMLPLAASLLSAGVTAIRTHVLPLWIGWFAAVVGVLLIFSPLWIPMLAVVLFGLVVGIALAVRPAETATSYRAPVHA
jgi:hypothetical protein